MIGTEWTLVNERWSAITETWMDLSSVAQSCPTLCDPMDCRMPGFPVHYQLPELTQIQVHWVGDAIQPSHSLSFLSPPASNLFQHQGLFQSVSSLHQWPSIGVSVSTSVLSMNTPGLISFRMDWLDLLAVQRTIKSLLQLHSSKALIFCMQLSLYYNTHIHTLPLEKT